VKILTFGFGTTPIFLKALFERVRSDAEHVDWLVVLPTSHHKKLMEDEVGVEKVLCLGTSLSLISTKTDVSCLHGYAGNIFRDIETTKKGLKHKKSNIQERKAITTYCLLKEFIVANKPDYILYIQPIEGMDGMILANIAKELGIPLAVPHHTRWLGLTFFASEPQEILPTCSRFTKEDLQWAEEFLHLFRCKIEKIVAENPSCKSEIAKHEFPPRIQRAKGYIYRLFKEPQNRELSTLQISLLNNWVPFYFRARMWLRKVLNKKYFNCNDFTKLPSKFVFFPLQYSPESSINVPAPYFIDQMRVIDAIRLSMPGDMKLVVKEHPVCLRVRPKSFMKKLLHTAGVVVVKYNEDTQKLIENAEITISVTGTAALEAYLSKKPSLVMGPTFFSAFLDGQCCIDELKTRIVNADNKKISDDEIIQNIAKVRAVSSDFVAHAPSKSDNRMMRVDNIEQFWKEFLIHVERQK
jgi:hypothetical protein